MKIKIVLSFMVMLFLAAISVSFISHKEGETNFVCSYNGSFVTNRLVLNTASAEMKESVVAIVNAVGLKKNFEVREANIDNAAAIVYQGERYVLYDPDFMK